MMCCYACLSDRLRIILGRSSEDTFKGQYRSTNLSVLSESLLKPELMTEGSTQNQKTLSMTIASVREAASFSVQCLIEEDALVSA